MSRRIAIECRISSYQVLLLTYSLTVKPNVNLLQFAVDFFAQRAARQAVQVH